MRITTKVESMMQGIHFGYWNTRTGGWIEIDSNRSEDLDAAAEQLKCSRELIFAIASSFENLGRGICTDLEDIQRKVA